MGTSELDISGKNSPTDSEFSQPRELLPLPVISPHPEIRALLIENIEETCETIEDCKDTVDMVDVVFGENGEWKLIGKDDMPNFYHTPSFMMKGELRRRLSPVYSLVNYRLRADKYPDGYNGHDGKHIEPVSEQTERLLRMSEYGQNEAVVTLGIVAAEGHDLGNIITRKGHSYESSALLANIVPSVLQSPVHWEAVETAIRYHDERALKELMSDWDHSTSEEDIEAFRALGPIIASLVIADKTDMGRHRTNQWATSVEVMERDDHAFVNFFGDSEGLHMAEDGKTLVWKVKYRPDITEEERPRFNGLSRNRSHHDGVVALVPQWLQDQLKEGRSSHFAGWQHKFMSIYKDRMELSALCAFSLFPDLEYFEVQANDMLNVTDGKPRRQAKETFARSSFDEDREDRDVIFTPKKMKKNHDDNTDSPDAIAPAMISELLITPAN